MTVLRKDASAISNFFDRIEAGLGKRGSSFMDLDAISHDADGDRFLVREFKEVHEVMSDAQRRTLEALAKLPLVTVWVVRRTSVPDILAWLSLSSGETECLTIDQYRDYVRRWWMCR